MTFSSYNLAYNLAFCNYSFIISHTINISFRNEFTMYICIRIKTSYTSRNYWIFHSIQSQFKRIFFHRTWFLGISIKKTIDNSSEFSFLRKVAFSRYRRKPLNHVSKKITRYLNLKGTITFSDSFSLEQIWQRALLSDATCQVSKLLALQFQRGRALKYFPMINL